MKKSASIALSTVVASVAIAITPPALGEETNVAGAAEVSSYTIRNTKTGVQLGYQPCTACATRWLNITEKTELLVKREPVSIEMAKIYSTNDAYLTYDANSNLVRLIASTR